MATGWTPVTSGSGGGGEIQGGVDKVGADGFAEPARASLIADAHATFQLGGSRITSIFWTTYKAAVNYIDFEVPAAKEGGFAYTAEVDLITANAGTSIRARIRNVTDGTTAVEGAVVTSTSWVRQSLSFVPTVAKRYRLELQRNNTTDETWGIGFIQRRDS